MAEVIIVVTIALIPAFALGFMTYLMALPGVVWSPFAALITWRMARSRGLDGGRYATVAAASSVLFLLPWLLLTFSLRRGVSDSSVRLSYILLYLGWLLGPIMIWGQHVANFEILTSFVLEGSSEIEPENPVMAYGVFAAMAVTWILSATLTLRNWSSLYDVTDRDLITLRHLMPFALAWVCILTVQGNIFFIG